MTEIDDIGGIIRFRVTNTCDFEVSIEEISAQLITCSNPSPLLSNDQGRTIEKRIDLGEVAFDSVHIIRRVSNSDIIYNIIPNTSGFFKLKFSPGEIKRARNMECKSRSRDISTARNGDLFLRLSFPNPTTSLNEKIVKKIN